MMDPIPLPENPFPTSTFHAVYDQCLTLETKAPGLKPINDCPPPIVCARLLGHLLRLAPAGTNGQRQLQREITTATDYAMLMQVAAAYLKDFILACKSRFFVVSLISPFCLQASRQWRINPIAIRAPVSLRRVVRRCP